MRCASCDKLILPPATTCGCATAAPASNAAAESGSPPPLPSPTDFVGRMIPSGNKPALISYYCAIFSLLPIVGILLGAIAVIFGLKGLRLVREHPEVRGGAHAWFGLIVGGVFGLAYLALVAVMLVAVQKHR